MTNTLFPTSTGAQQNRWSRHIRESLDVVSENECAAHATLYYNAPIDFYVYIEPTCYLGDLAYTTTEDLEITINSVKIRATNALEHVTTTFDAVFDLPDFAWNRYMIGAIDLLDGEGLTECGVICELHAAHCDFF